MILIKAENQELALLISINQRTPSHDPQTGRGTGYYLALTFGTLLSSQRADAHEPRPSGLRSRRLLVYAAQRSTPAGASRRPQTGSSAAQRESYLRWRGGVKPHGG